MFIWLGAGLSLMFLQLTIGGRGSKFFQYSCFFAVIVFGFFKYSHQVKSVSSSSFPCNTLLSYGRTIDKVGKCEEEKAFYNLMTESQILVGLCTSLYPLFIPPLAIPSLVDTGRIEGTGVTEMSFLQVECGSGKHVFSGKQAFVIDNTLGIFDKVYIPSSFQSHENIFWGLQCENLVRFLEVQPQKSLGPPKTAVLRNFSIPSESKFGLQQFAKMTMSLFPPGYMSSDYSFR